MLMQDRKELVGNKGEWSEVYTLVKLLADGKLYQSDFNLNKDLNNVYEIIRAYKDEKDYKLQFDRDGEISLYKLNDDNTKSHITKFTIEQLSELTNVLLDRINKGQGKTFKIIEVDSILQDQFKISKLKANPDSKADIKLRIYDHRLAKETDLGFSIKSLLGKDSTLFNTGPGNNFIYQISPDLTTSIDNFNKETYSPPGRISKLTYRLEKLKEQGLEITYKDIQSRQLWKNLKMVDGDLPEIMASALYYRWIYKTPDLASVAELLEINDPLNFYEGLPSEQKLYENKIKRFLSEAAMGMTSETPWLGEYDSFGGVIIVKNDGDIVCFHIYDFNLFRNYLIKNTRFEQPSTGEDEDNPGHERTKKGTKKFYYGWLYKDDDNLKFKINLQVRFK